MKLTEEENRKALDWYQRYLNDKAKFSELEDILFEENRYHRDDYEEDGVISFTSRGDIDVDTEELAESLGLEEGEEPTDKQIEEYQKSVFEGEVCGGSETYCQHYYVYRLEIKDIVVWLMSLHGDGGYREDFEGPFDSDEDCLSEATFAG
jgi:hypothetical protein